MNHGTTHLYNKGCRCDLCKQAKSGANQKHRDSVLKPESKPRATKVVLDFEMILKVLARVRKIENVSAEELAKYFELPIRTVNRILCDLMRMGLIESDFVVTRFRDGYYVYSSSEKTNNLLSV